MYEPACSRYNLSSAKVYAKRSYIRMNREDISKKVIETYQADEKMMVLVYAQWCINKGLDPIALYKKSLSASDRKSCPDGSHGVDRTKGRSRPD